MVKFFAPWFGSLLASSRLARCLLFLSDIVQNDAHPAWQTDVPSIFKREEKSRSHVLGGLDVRLEVWALPKNGARVGQAWPPRSERQLPRAHLA